MSNSYLSPKQRDALACFARILTEGVGGGSVDVESLARNCCEKVATVPAYKRAQLGQAIDLLASPIGPLLGLGRLTRFAALGADDQRRCLMAWGTSRLPILRTAYQALRRLVLVTHYSAPAAGQAIGYRGAFRHRTPELPWEGPLPPAEPTAHAAPSAPEPVARTPIRLPVDLPAEAPPRGVHVRLDRPLHRTADVVIIGSGAGGSVAAAELAEAGFEVVILDGGGWHTRADFSEDEAAMADRLLAEGGLRTTDDGAVALLQGETVGGGTTVNWMMWLRTPDFVLEEWAREAGFPETGSAALTSVFEELEARLHVASVPRQAHSANNQLILDGAAALGWAADSGRLNAKGCVRCGHCTAGCRHDAKQSALITTLPRALARGATLYANSFATRIERREHDRGTGTPPLKRVHVRVNATPRAQALTIDAPVVIVAGGAIESPALLLRSGLGTEATGRYLRLHPTVFGFGVYDREIAAGTGIPMTVVCDQHLRWRNSNHGFWIEAPPTPPWLAAAAIPSFGSAHAARMRDYNRLGVMVGLTRDGAVRSSSNGQVTVDRRGRTRIGYQLTPEDAQRVYASLDAMARLHFAAGATEVFTSHADARRARSVGEIPSLTQGRFAPNRLSVGSAHVTGSCRIGAHRRTSAVTCEGEHWDARGLYIIDGSVLPSAPAVNPQATIMAVATVLARRIAARYSGVPHARGGSPHAYPTLSDRAERANEEG